MWSSLSLPFALTILLTLFAIKIHGGCWQKSYVARIGSGSAIYSVKGSQCDAACRHQLWMRIARCGASCSASDQSRSGSSKRDDQVPKLFQSESDEIYDRYAACLAATEGLRRLRDQVIQNQEDPALSPSKETFRSKKSMREAKELAMASYVENASKVIESMGMPVSEFNVIGRKVCKDFALKEKVLEQAYLYRIQSSVHLDSVLEESKAPLTAQLNSKFDQFCQSMWEIEHLRLEQAEQLKQSLRVDKLPAPLETNDIPTVRNAVEEFAASADRIVKQHGLEASEFNQLLERTKRNPFFQSKVFRRIGAIQQ